MKKILLLICLLPSFAFADGWQIPNPAGTPRAFPTPGTPMERANVDVYGNQQVVSVGGGGSGLTQSVIPVSNATSLNGLATGAVGWTTITQDGIEAGSTSTVINATAHVARVGDIINPYSGTAGNINAWSIVSAVTANTITLSNALPTTPTNGDAFNILRPTPISSTNSATGGALQTAISYNQQLSAALGILKQEDLPAASGDALVGVAYEARDTLATLEETSDYILPKADLLGRTITTLAPAGETWQACGTSTASTADVAIKAAVVSNRIYVTGVNCKNTSATVGTTIDFKDATTVIAVGGVSSVQATADGSYTANFNPPLRGTSNTALNFAANVAVTSLTCCANGYISVN